MPALVLWGERDRFFPVAGGQTAGGDAHGAGVVLAGLGTTGVPLDTIAARVQKLGACRRLLS